jgi:transposase
VEERLHTGNMKNSDHKRKADSDSKADKKRIKELERELARKEKALAEAAALLLLR